jgi:hypothetical protein
MGTNCPQCRFKKLAEMRSCSCTNEPRGGGSTWVRTRICRFGMGHGQITIGRWRRWCRRRGCERPLSVWLGVQLTRAK